VRERADWWWKLKLRLGNSLVPDVPQVTSMTVDDCLFHVQKQNPVFPSPSHRHKPSFPTPSDKSQFGKPEAILLKSPKP
jgi:hypothetical protein